MNFWNSSVASITASLQDMVTQLSEHETSQRKRAQHHMDISSAASAEAFQAQRVREKLASILD